MSKQATITAIANEAVDRLQVDLEYMVWFDSLSWATSNALKSGHTIHAERLAGVIQYLADDYRNILSCEVKSLDEQLDALDVRV